MDERKIKVFPMKILYKNLVLHAKFSRTYVACAYKILHRYKIKGTYVTREFDVVDFWV